MFTVLIAAILYVVTTVIDLISVIWTRSVQYIKAVRPLVQELRRVSRVLPDGDLPDSQL